MSNCSDSIFLCVYFSYDACFLVMHFIYFIFCYTALGRKSVAFKHAIEIHFDLTFT